MFTGNPLDLLLPSTGHLLVLLIVLAVAAFRAGNGSRLRRWRFVLLLAVAWTWVIATPVVAHTLAFRFEADYPPQPMEARPATAPIIVVLASGEAWERSTFERRQLDLASYRRALAGVALWQETGGTLIYAGAAWPGEPQPVSTRMAKLAEDLGVPAARVVIESQSLNTYENLRNVAGMLPRGQKIFLVTSALHMSRALGVARAFGLEVIPVPCDYRAKYQLTWRAWLPDSQSLPLLTWVMHEWLGTMYYRLRGWM